MSVYKRGKTYWVRFTFQGTEYRRSAKTSIKHEAVEYERHLLKELGRMHRGGKERIDYSTAMLKFLNEYLPSLKPSAAERYRTSARKMQNHFETLYLDEINKSKISEYITYRKREKVSDTTIRRDLACLSSMLTCAVNWDFIEFNPVKNFDKRSVKEGAPRVKYFTRAQFALLLNECSDRMKTLIVFSVETGMRREEQFSLEWSQVDLRKREVLLTKTKTDSPRVVPLSNLAAAQITAQVRYPHSPYVFNNDEGGRWRDVTGSFRGACKRAKLEGFRWHDLRKTCGSWMIQSGVDIHTVSRFLGHKSVTVTERSYAFLRTEELHAAVARSTKHGTNTTDN